MSLHHDHNEADKKNNRPDIERDSRYWLSLEHYSQDPAFMQLAETEFQSSPLRQEENAKKDGVARREFLKLMGASLALAGSGCVRRPVQKIVPYNKQPEEVTLGVPNFYASSIVDGNEAYGVLVKTREGRPIKIEGNSEFPWTKGGTSVRSQAAILELYDPERLKGPQKNLFNEKKSNKDTIGTTWEELDKKVVEQLGKGGVVVLTNSINSPSTRSIVNEFGQAFGGQHVVWDALAYDDVRRGQEASYGDARVPNYRFDRARVIVSIDADFLGTWMAPVTFTKQFTMGRKAFDKMNRLYVFDSAYSLTGANADYRVRIKPSQQLAIAMALVNEVAGKEMYAVNVADLGLDSATIKKAGEDLKAARGESLVVAGGLATWTENSSELQIVVNQLNSLLDNDGKTVVAKGSPGHLMGDSIELKKLIDRMEKGEVKTLVIHGVNPVYTSAAGEAFKEALKKVAMVVYTGDRQDETGACASFLAPDNHPLENWGDAQFADGFYAIQQPTIRPMYETRSFQLSLMTWAYLANKGPKRLLASETYYDYLRNFWREEIMPKAGGSNFDSFWKKVLQDGFVGSADAATSAGRSFKGNAGVNRAPAKKSGYELVLYPSIAMGDGSHANNAWLQELPDPVSKICWDNFAAVSPATAKNLNLQHGSLLEVKVGDKTVTLPTHIQPGLHDEVVAMAVGYGRTAAGKVGNNIGVNVYPLMAWTAKGWVASGQTAELKPTGKKTDLAVTQAHHTMEGRQIVVEAGLEDYKKDKGANVHRHHTWSIWSGHQYNGHKWAMAVDLNTCTGCSACVVACQSENNTMVVGKKYVLQGREMHWLRIDRYYSGTPNDPSVVFQPVMCQHCDNAPCETVCPVMATSHSQEGLNDMIYNRCVGTRYCANNCPYKVRRFNWFNFAKQVEKPQHLALNPDVTVRPRGVMEKCTFCVQRIKAGKNVAKLEGRALKDGEIKTACQTACPADAIIFGDVNDPDSEVSRRYKDERAYALLEEWHAAPAVRYMSKIRNNDKVPSLHHEEKKEHGEKV